MTDQQKTDSKTLHTRRNRILQVARNLMLEKGYSATTVDHICEKAKVAKGGFFHHFSSKEVMAREVLERFIESLFTSMSLARDPRIEEDPLKRLKRMFSQLATAYENMQASPGCLLGMLTMELSANDEHFGKTCGRAFNAMRNGIKKEIQAAGKFHNAKGLQPQKLADAAVASIQGAAILARANNDPTRIRNTLKTYSEMLEQLIVT